MLGGFLTVRVLVFRPSPTTAVPRFSGSVFLRAPRDGDLWRLLRSDRDWMGSTVYLVDSPGLLPGEAFHRAAAGLDARLAIPYLSAPPREPLSLEELGLVASVFSTMDEEAVTAYVVMLS